MLITPRTALASNCAEDCVKVIEKADTLILQLENQNKVYKEYSSALEKALEEEQLRVDELTAEANAWYKNPYVMGLLGVAAGVLAHEFAGR